MKRRTVVTLLGATFAGVSGCQEVLNGGDSTPDEPTSTDLPTVTAVVGHRGGLSPMASSSVRVERGEVAYLLRCRDQDLGPYEVSEPLPQTEYAEFASFVETLDPESWQSSYECTDQCILDDGREFVTLTVEGQTYETWLDMEVEPLAGIAALQRRVRNLGERIDESTPTCFETETSSE